MQIPFVASYASIVESKENVDPSGALSSQSEISSDNNSDVEDTQEMLQTIPEDRPNPSGVLNQGNIKYYFLVINNGNSLLFLTGLLAILR
jgi:hypothetical protein